MSFWERQTYNQLGGIPVTDVAGGFAYQYTYDTLGRLMQANRTATGTANHAKNMQASYTYDTNNRITEVAYNIPGVDNTFASYYYSSDSTSTDVAVGALTKMSMFSKGWINYTYDAQGRLFTRDIGGLLNESYAYLSKPSDTTNYTTTLVSAKGIADQDDTSLKYFTYNYNSLGYITTEQETRSGTKLQYSYDEQGQLLTAKKSVNDVLQKTYTYTYDTYGNIRTATDGTTSHTYTYGDSDWRDLLTAYDGTALTYDTIGNPTSYYNGASYTMTWRNGRELQALTTGGKTTSYEYDVDGLRTLKTNSDGSYSVYYWLGNLLLAEERHTGNSTRVLVFSYDENNSPIGFQFKTNDGPWYYYLYAKNIQGDIVALYRRDVNADGTRSATHIANYEYDPWGKILSIKNAAGQDISNYPDNSANVNPLRYRGYYYDNESGFYYLQSRYYDPSIGRFINADTYASTGQDLIGYNMFAYCGNNPVTRRDPSGDVYIVDTGCTSALDLLYQWLFGDGSDQSYGDGSALASSFRHSEYMNGILEECLEEYISTGQSNFSGKGYISGFSEFNLWMGVRSFDYEVTISSETRTSGIIFKEQYTEYTFNVKIIDEYNFNSGKDAGDGLGSILNNAAYNLHKEGIGHDYKWKLNYTVSYSSRSRTFNFVGLFL